MANPVKASRRDALKNVKQNVAAARTAHVAAVRTNTGGAAASAAADSAMASRKAARQAGVSDRKIAKVANRALKATNKIVGK